MASSSKSTLSIKLEFGGGTELLLAPPRAKSHTISLPATVSATSASSSSKIPKPSVTAPAPAPAATENGSALAGTADARADAESHGRPTDMRFLVQWLRQNMIVEREELFVDADGQGIRPGILVLINDADWELEGELQYELQDGDEICFISTLHGG